jgi:hypothetical protein
MSLTTIRVLHVEDNPGDARLMQEILREAGTPEFDLSLASGLGEAVDRVGIEPFDIVLRPAAGRPGSRDRHVSRGGTRGPDRRSRASTTRPAIRAVRWG